MVVFPKKTMSFINFQMNHTIKYQTEINLIAYPYPYPQEPKN